MTLAIRVIATCLVDPQRGMVKGSRFDNWRVVGDPVNWARVMAQVREVDEMVLLDVTATSEGRCIGVDLVRQVAAQCFIPLAVGGGITSADQAIELIRAGADKIVLGTAAFRRRPLISEIADRAGSQAVVVSVDVRQYPACPPEVVVCAGREQTQLHPNEYARHVVGFGAGEIFLQSVNRDGEMSGYDLEQIALVRAAINVPLIASSGAGTVQHFVEAVRAGADAVAAGAVFQFTDITPNDVKQAIVEAGYPVRLMKAA